MKFPNYIQPDNKDCGPTCLRIISKYYGKSIPLQTIRDIAETTREGSSLLNLSDAAERIGFKTLGVKANVQMLMKEVPLPCILHWHSVHFVVLYKVKKKQNDYIFYISDPSYGLITYNSQDFLKAWIGSNADIDVSEGVALLLETTPEFSKNDWDGNSDKTRLSYLFKYLLKYKALFIQLIVSLVATSLISLIFPFITQSVVDTGIQNQDVNFIFIVLLAQIMLFTGKAAIEVIRSWILLHLSTRINISIVSDFFIKLMNLPISFFDTRMTGDIMQRISDHHRIEQLLTNSSLNTIFNLFSLVVYSVILLLYNYKLFLIYLCGSLVYIFWISFFLNRRRELDYKKFSQVSQEQSAVIELINGMQEIKMHNAEKQKRWKWEFLQVKLFKINIETLSLEQLQTVGGNFINQMKDVFISFFTAVLVIDGKITLGMMLSTQYIIGQLSVPLAQFLEFLKNYQDAKISLERLGEIHNKDNEEDTNTIYEYDLQNNDIIVDNLDFRYTGTDNYVFENLNIVLPHQKTTAIVGASGSGKTTLLKLLLKFYEPTKGTIKLGRSSLSNVPPRIWREKCGVVMQEGYIFNDSIAGNIAIGDDVINKEKLRQAVEIANIKEFVEGLPLNYNTKIGNEGAGMSGGQKQRLQIARAVYKSPEYIFFDEATSALDANNEKVIMENLEQFFKGKTAIVIAHRLSTVKHADKIIVLDKGKVVEEGNHSELVALKGEYFKLVKNQLELGN
ncbi:peptidase domain-containing ABC transporter [uncultured Chryseobacterium sp.]|uniref:peptidase domain-containing ABC transporter n=1 Tax=uncultured Chryseobacterium sp. TaxID=259322 RepID=UPI0025F1A695|nr:peptidase domain-containing ABC transporter [uncultured Chryseobacterium sp.]